MTTLYQTPKAIVSLILGLALLILLPSCSTKKDKAEQAKPDGATQAVAPEESNRQSSPSTQSGPGPKNRAAVSNRKLIEAGSTRKVHPAAKMERPDKWKRQEKPSANDILAGGSKNLMPEEQAKQMSEIGLDKTKVYQTASSPQEVVERFKQKSPRASVYEDKGKSVVSIPVKEGTVVVTTGRGKDGQTVVNEILLTETKRPISTPLWLKEQQIKARKR